MNNDGAIRLVCAILFEAAEDYKKHLRWLKKSKGEAERKCNQYEVDRDEKFFRTTPFVHFLPISGDDIITQLRRQVEREDKQSGYRTIIRKDG